MGLFVLVSLASGQKVSESSEHEFVAEVDSVAFLDSLRRAEAAALVNRATESHMNLKRVQYDGTVERELYPMVIDTHHDVIAALDNELVESSDRTRLRGVLLDLDPLLIRGATYYSGQGNREEMNRFATACVDTRLRADMKQMPFGKAEKLVYPSIVYCAASSAYNSGDYKSALKYFEEYLDGEGGDHREQIALFYGQAAINTGTQADAADRMVAEANRFPTNYNLLMVTLQNCLDAGMHDKMQPLMERALSMRPDDEQLINVQASLLEDIGNFDGALTLYSRLYDLHPESLGINKHLALCYYNLGAEHYNKAIVSDDDKIRKRSMRQSKAYFMSAASKLAAVVENDPTSAKYLKALAMTYGCLGESERLAEINTRLTALGMTPVTITGMPETVTYADNTPARASAAIPTFPEFAQVFVDQNIARFATRGEFERTEDFEKRMSQENFDAEYERLYRQAEQDYLKKYGGKLRISDLSLEPYDIDHETYRINSAMGPVILKVPYKDKEAETFKSGWNGVQLRNPRYFIRDNKVAIAAVDFVMPGGKTYSYQADDEAPYDYRQLIAGASVGSRIAHNAGSSQSDDRSNATATRVVQVKSDVDRDIPITSRRAEKTVVLIWANENYKNVSGVSGALNDGESFAEYCRKTLGVPDAQVIEMSDVTYAEMLTSMSRLRQITNTLGQGVDLIFFYAGHGIPDEATKDAFLLPIDGDGVTTVVSYPMRKLYSDLSSTRADNVMVFLDACFSGASRDGGMLAEARGVALKPNQAAPEGSMFVLSAATGQETALPYKEKNHGMFTYFLLKKLQESKGSATLSEIADYVIDNVRKNSLTVNRKSQTPTMRVSGNLAREYKSKSLRP